ncbi:hypothetical protein IJ732_03825, partial [bacterium]|nr:hypothetical protein [bacterium]
LADGSSYSYECDETKCNSIIIDTNGDKRPNSAGKDRYRMLVTDHGLIAQGESEYCGTIDGGLDCGKYILTYHKLFDGLINNCTAYDNGECSQCENGYQNNGSSCRDIRENTCDTYSGTTCTKCTSENLLVDGECLSMTSLKCQTSTDGKTCSECESGNYLTTGKSCETLPNNCTGANGDGSCTGCTGGNYLANGGTCETLPSNCTSADGSGSCQTCSDNYLVYGGNCVLGKEINGVSAYKVGNQYVADIGFSGNNDATFIYDGHTLPNFSQGAMIACSSKGMRLATREELLDLYNNHQNEPGVPTQGSWYWTGDSTGSIVSFIPGDENVTGVNWDFADQYYDGHSEGLPKKGYGKTYCIAD